MAVRKPRSGAFYPSRRLYEARGLVAGARTSPFLVLLLSTTSAFAGARHFTFIYEAPTSPPGSFEIENYATTRFSDGFTDANFRHELEIEITEHFQANLNLANGDST